ncbi:MAG: hypothetical protein HYZ49_03370 [Chloroflexi bacterium]|nr:hypothetical protein [Chloroflexota bacterium]
MERQFAEISLSPGKGYEISQHSSDLTSTELQHLWEKALPQGNGWPSYIGMESLKCFRLSDNKIAVSQARVTNQEDEFGRRGIFRARVDIFTSVSGYIEKLTKAYTQILSSARLRESALHQPSVFGVIEQVLSNRQVILASPFINRENWRYMEAIILKAILSLPTQICPLVSLTTFALSPYRESFVVALPMSIAKDLKKPFITVGGHI